MAVIGSAVVVVLGTACFLDTRTTLCETSGLRCKPGQTCAAMQGVCIEIGGCGDGVVSGDEVCDDGNIRNGDGCSADCSSLELCGNGVVDRVRRETCDDGNTTSGDGCDSECHDELCGNSRLDSGEVCDDGNTTSSDGCRSDCASNEACGNGVLDAHLGEVCEFPDAPFPGPVLDLPSCDSDCTAPKCGDGHVNPTFPIIGGDEPDHNEQCDPGMIVNGMALDSLGCDSNCTFVACGDGHVNRALVMPGIPLEECDLPNMGGVDTSMCDGDCTFPRCGDHHTNPKFILDPVTMQKEECDDGASDTGGCDSDCTRPVCGDGHPNSLAGEDCDPGLGKGNDSSSCDGDCTPVECGDGHINTVAGEVCDPAATPTGCPAGHLCLANSPDPSMNCRSCP